MDMDITIGITIFLQIVAVFIVIKKLSVPKNTASAQRKEKKN